ncbi:MAG: virulence-associated E family protein, partial [Pseudomonadota bacterium]
SKSFTWPQLLDKFREPTRTPETFAEYQALPKAEQDRIKDVGGYVGGVLKGGRRTAEAVAWRHILNLDGDFAEDSLPSQVFYYGCQYVVHSTRKHTAAKPRYRVIFPLSRPVTADEYQAVGRKVASFFGMNSWDDTTFEPHRLMYWPSVSSDQDYFFEFGHDTRLDVDAVLASYGPDEAWRDSRLWPVSDRTVEQIKTRKDKAGDPRKKPGLIGAFCRAYTIDEVVGELLPGIYTSSRLAGRYTFAQGTSVAGLVVYDRGLWAYSHHGTDPAQGLHNAWDLVRIHKFGEMDDVAEDTPINRLPSQAAMLDFARQDSRVKTILAQDRAHDIQTDFSPIENWHDQIDFDRYGQPYGTRQNVILILTNDEKLQGRIRYNQFECCPVAEGDLPWRKSAGVTPWTDTDDAGLCHYLENVWSFTNVRAIHDALLLVQQSQAFHPVRDYLNDLVWDGVPRIDTLLVDFLGADDMRYTRMVIRKTLTAAVARIMTPGTKFDTMLTFVGFQGGGKSTFIHTLGGQWSSDSFSTVTGKEAIESLHGVWLVEAAELNATKKADVEATKHFLSKTIDRYRPAYARRVASYPRQCIFIGSTNQPQYLIDETGNRRFWPVTVRPKPVCDWQPELVAIRDQIWAEAVMLWQSGELPYLDEATEREAQKKQELYRVDDGLASRLEKWLNEPVPKDWKNKTIKKRLESINSSFDYQGEAVLRDRICAREVWVECLQGYESAMSKAKSIEINAAIRRIPDWKESSGADFGSYGRGRGFIRASALEAPF